MADNSVYGAFAEYYDKFMKADLDYDSWFDSLLSLLKDNGLKRGGSVLDLACGSGAFSNRFAERGFDVVGIDVSEEMLAIALSDAYSLELPRNTAFPLYVKQDMRALDLYGTVDAAVCCLDGINYLESTDELKAVFSRVKLFLEPSAPFVFDVNTPYKLESVLADNTFVYESEDRFCTWENSFDKETLFSTFRLTLFEKQKNGLWKREEETQSERAFSDDEIISALKESGFESISVFSSLDGTPVSDTDERHFFICK